jgi:hypothetical protein
MNLETLLGLLQSLARVHVLLTAGVFCSGISHCGLLRRHEKSRQVDEEEEK